MLRFSSIGYVAAVVGAWWDGMPLDHHFNSGTDDWAAMRSTWTDNNGLYVAMKAGNMTYVSPPPICRLMREPLLTCSV